MRLLYALTIFSALTFYSSCSSDSMSDNPDIESCDIVGEYGQCFGTINGELIIATTVEFRENNQFLQNGVWNGATWELDDCETIIVSGRDRPDIAFFEMEILSFIEDTLIVNFLAAETKYIRNL